MEDPIIFLLVPIGFVCCYGFIPLISSYLPVCKAVGDFLDGLEASGLHDLSRVTSVASFFVSRVDTLLDKMLEKIRTLEALNRQGKRSTVE
ncbi:putative transaldolase [Helianthus annuus]|nr:putative transaldolase [Helianthus annuus]